jgi:hypothetical protein
MGSRRSPSCSSSGSANDGPWGGAVRPGRPAGLRKRSAASAEEHDLVGEFGDTYKDYRRRTPMLVPFTKKEADPSGSARLYEEPLSGRSPY